MGFGGAKTEVHIDLRVNQINVLTLSVPQIYALQLTYYRCCLTGHNDHYGMVVTGTIW